MEKNSNNSAILRHLISTFMCRITMHYMIMTLDSYFKFRKPLKQNEGGICI